jgi:hypothetical protein
MIWKVLMRTILFAVALLIFTASAHAESEVFTTSAHAGSQAPHFVQCKPNTAQIDGHQVTTECAPKNLGSYEEWRKNGTLDRADGPASIIRNWEGTVLSELWYRDGMLDRADGPAIIEHDAATGKMVVEHWFKDGQSYRADGPPTVVHDLVTGTTYGYTPPRYTYFNVDSGMRDGEQVPLPPAAASSAPHAVECKPDIAQIDGHQVTTTCGPNGITEEWRKGGKLDRADGPAMVWRDPATGTATYEAWFKGGEEIAPQRAADK